MNEVDNTIKPLKRFYVVKTACTLYETWAYDKDDALDMVKNKTNYGLAGAPYQRGVNTLFTTPKLEKYEVTDEILATPQPNATNGMEGEK